MTSAAIGGSSKSYNSTEAMEFPTISGALGRFEALNKKLDEIHNLAVDLSNQIGGPRGVSAQAESAVPAAAGAVDRLNRAAHLGHQTASEIEDTLKSIARVLG